jgi:hypothetical protein
MHGMPEEVIDRAMEITSVTYERYTSHAELYQADNIEN